jgi:hypothetical protein
MDLENLKNNWKEEEVFPPEISLEKQNEIRNPLEKIKKNIKFELWSTLPIFPLALWILYKMVEDKTIVLFASTLIGVMFLVVIFYAFKIYKFYKEINTNSLSSFQHILEMEYQMKYYRDLYQSYFIALLPIMMSEFFIIFLYSRKNEFENFESLAGTLMMSMMIGFGLLFLFWFLWYQFFYGRHFKKIKSIIKNIK